MPLEDCVQGRALTVTSSAALLLLATVIELTAPAWAARSISTGEAESPPVAWAADALG